MITEALAAMGSLGATAACFELYRTRSQLAQTQVERDVARYDAAHDQLTGLLNRAGLDTAMAQRADCGRPWSLIMFDLDDFKRVNDTLGHDAGDEVLIAVSARLFLAFDHPGDMVGRLSGDEFVALTDTDPQMPTLTFLRARNALIAVRTPIELESGHEVTVTASVGVVSVLAGAKLPRVLRSADIATYKAKAHGGNQVAEYGLPGELAPVLTSRPSSRLRNMPTLARTLGTVTR